MVEPVLQGNQPGRMGSGRRCSAPSSKPEDKPSISSRGSRIWGLLDVGTTVNLYFRFAFPFEGWRFQ